MRASWLLATAFFLFLGPAALADSIQVSVSSTATVNVTSPSDNFYGTYLNVAGQPFVVGDVGFFTGMPVPFSNLSVLLPANSTFLGAEVSFTVPDEVIGTGQGIVISPFNNLIDPSLPSVAPTFSDDGIATLFPSVTDFGPGFVVNGNEVSTDYLLASLLVRGTMQPALIDPGSNWAGFIGGNAQVDLPYTVTLDVTYSPVPEPSSLFLFGTGALGLLGVFRGQIAQKN